MTFPIPANALDDRLAIVGTAGSGKTYLTLGAAEHLLARKSRIIFIDPLGVAWGLRLCADGKTASPFQPIIFGGAHGDLPINEHAGALIGETVATMRESSIIDLSQLGTKAAERRFMLAFLTALYRHTNKEPVHVIVDEADMFAPQKLLDKDGDAAKLLGMMETVVRRGRVRGFIPWLITQRPAVLSKDVLSQADGLVALKLTSSQDRDAIGSWIEGQADKAEGKAMLASLPGKQIGEGVLWIPGRGILRDAVFPPKATYDSSRTPKRGEKRQAAELKPIDLGALKERLAVVETDAKANDPKALKAKLAGAEAELAKLRKLPAASNQVAKSNAPDQKALKRQLSAARAEGYSAGWLEGDRDGFARGTATALEQGFRAIQGAMKAFVGVEFVPSKRLPKVPASVPARAQPAAAPRAAASPVRPAPRQGGGTVSLPPGERAVLIAAAQFEGVEREQLTVLTGYKRSSRDAYIQRLREKGFVEVSGSTVTMTAEGEQALPADYEPLRTGQALQEYWLGRLPEGERRVLEVLIEAYPESVDRAAIDAATDYKRSSRDAYLQRMKAKRLWDAVGGEVRAAEMLF